MPEPNINTQRCRHVRSNMRKCKYPAERMTKLMEAISRDMQQQLLQALSSPHLMHVRMDQFNSIIHEANNIFNIWTEEWDKLVSALRVCHMHYERCR